MHELSIGIGHNQPPPSGLVRGQPWPEDAQAVISRRKPSVTTSGRADMRGWVLRFERRSPQTTEPLMGWIAGDDPLAQVELTFETREQAVAYADREGLACRVEGETGFPDKSGAASRPRRERDAVESAMSGIVRLSLLQNRYGRCDTPVMPELDRAFVNPASVFGSPDDVLRHPLLTLDCKREILWRWAWDEYLLDLADTDGMPEGQPSRLPEVRAALRCLDAEWSPDPAAPAAFVVSYVRDGRRLAA
ncbi:NADH dehydrogenase ubiquinone Fe-S protein 4 [Microvirga makkahensis]|uniref:ETC complex I subunit n=1 Tax=Microvirga makkahensis TaxID=1128670 RepID=A0A7X3SNZ5_9HYPH|nr:NADH dehydrogenase ubiquinone Fe-S protein 4 [Microvirga makkahensis]MXQ11916.1 hypothetical protein [Microvirga makkahensis]